MIGELPDPEFEDPNVFGFYIILFIVGVFTIGMICGFVLTMVLVT